MGLLRPQAQSLVQTKDPSTEVSAASCPCPGFLAHEAGLSKDNHVPLSQNSNIIFQGTLLLY